MGRRSVERRGEMNKWCLSFEDLLRCGVEEAEITGAPGPKYDQVYTVPLSIVGRLRNELQGLDSSLPVKAELLGPGSGCEWHLRQ
jgi:hypothetical protein